ADAEPFGEPVLRLDADEADRQEDEVDIERDVLDGDAPPRARRGVLRVLDAAGPQRRDLPVPPVERHRLDLPPALAALVVYRVGAQQRRPLGPRLLRRSLARRRGAVGDLDYGG